MRVAVLGAGAVGARVARQLLTGDAVDRIVLRDTDAERLAWVARTLGDRVEIQHHPFPSALDADLVVVATPGGTQLPAVLDAVDRGQTVIATGDGLAETVGMLGAAELAGRAGTPVVLGAGFAPGLSCVLAMHGAAWLDRVDEVHVAKVGTGGPACALVHHRALSRLAYDWRDGEWVRRPGGSGRELCWFPEPVGPHDCYRGALAGPVLLHHALPDVGWITSRVAATRRDRLTAPMPMLAPPHSEGGPGAIRVELRGQRAGAHEVVVLGAAERPAVAAAMVAATTAEWALDGRLSVRGMAGLGEMVDPVGFLHDLGARGLQVEVFEGDHVAA